MAHLPGRRSLYLCISPNSKLLAWVDHDHSVCLWDLANGREIPFLGPPLPVPGWRNLAFYPDSDHLMFGTARGMVETWDIRTVRRVSSLEERGTASLSVRAAGGSLGPGRTLWSSQTGSRVFAFPQESGMIWSDALSPDGERLAIGLADGGLAIWNVPRIQAQLAKIGLAWRADARPPQQQQPEPQPFVPATPLEREHQVTHYSNLARRLAWVGRLAEAEDAYRAALKLMPHDPVAHEDLGKFLEDQARYGEAEAEFNEAIKLLPEHGSFWVQRLGLCRYGAVGQRLRGFRQKLVLGAARLDLCRYGAVGQSLCRFHQSGTSARNRTKRPGISRAMLHLRDGNLDGYRSMCSEMLERFDAGATWTCTLSPESRADPDRHRIAG